MRRDGMAIARFDEALARAKVKRAGNLFPRGLRGEREGARGKGSESFHPPQRIEPEVGRSSPAIKFSNVDLPEPELPSSARNSPVGTVSDTSSTARIQDSPIR